MRYLYASLAAAALAAASLPASAGTLLVPQHFSTIQAALNAAKPYDMVLVSAKPNGGVYSESVTINTPHVTLQGRGNPIIDGTGFVPVSVPIPGSYYSNTVYPNAIDIRADYAAISGLTVQNVPGAFFNVIGGAGINAGYNSADGNSSYGFSGIRISGVTLSNDSNGIVVNGVSSQVVNGKYTFTSAQGFSLIGCTLTGSLHDAVDISSANNMVISGNKFLSNNQTGLSIGFGFSEPIVNVLIAANVFKNNGGDGMDANATGLTITANEAASNTGYGILANTLTYSFSGPPVAAAGAAPTSVLFNSAHDNGLGGLSITGAQTITANSLANNAGYGIYLLNADFSTVSFNSITGTGLAVPAFAQSPYDNGTGIYADDTGVSFGPVIASASEKIFGNQISGSAGDGIYLGAVTGCTLSANAVSGSLGVGIHASDFPSPGNTPNTITQNRVVHNTLFDLRDDSNAADDLTYNGSTFYGDNEQYGASINIWTKNVFGTSDPVGLSK